MGKHRLLLIEDDPSIREMVKEHLQTEGYAVTCAADGEEAMRRFGEEEYDLVLLDLMLPKKNGFDCLQAIRSTSTVPVLILSAKDSEVDKALGLGFGADDYVAKPFSMIELTARIQAAIRRATRYSASGKEDEPDEAVTIGDLTVDFKAMTVFKRGKPVKLTGTEYRILELFVRYPKQVFTKANLYRSVWNEEYYGDENVISVHMRRLRAKIEDDPSQPQYIQTMWGIGYRLGDFS